MTEGYSGMDAEPLPEDDSPVERNTRGIVWLVIPPALGTLLGAGLGILYQVLADARLPASSGPEHAAVMTGMIYGMVIGGAVGVFVWVAFPYKNEKPTRVD